MTIRVACADDMPFILSGWAQSLKKSRNIMLEAVDEYAKRIKPRMLAIMERGDALTLVAEGSVLQGFICAAPAYCFYVYVAAPFRRQQIATSLFIAAGIDTARPFGYACQTKASWELRKVAPLAHYDPYFARYPEKDVTP